MSGFIKPNWPASSAIQAFTTTRAGGVSLPPFCGFNVGMHVGDDPAHVVTNRNRLLTMLPAEPIWLTQTHSTVCVNVDENSARDADAAITRNRNTVLAIMTADCVPILICNRQGDELAAIHAGWRGLLNGVIENTVKMLLSNRDDLMAWIGPHICGQCFQVGDEVREAFLHQYPFSHDAFIQDAENKWRANMVQMIKLVFAKLAIDRVYESNLCTFEQNDRFFSYRREGQTGRMISLIWFD